MVKNERLLIHLYYTSYIIICRVGNKMSLSKFYSVFLIFFFLLPTRTRNVKFYGFVLMSICYNIVKFYGFVEKYLLEVDVFKLNRTKF